MVNISKKIPGLSKISAVLPQKKKLLGIKFIEVYLLITLIALTSYHWALSAPVLCVILWLFQPTEYLELLNERRKGFIENIFDVSYQDGKITTEYFLKKIESGEWYRKIVCGVSDKIQDFLVVDPFPQPGVLSIGGMGSGKTTTVKGIVCTSLATSSKCAIFIIVDVSDKGAGDYSTLFKYKDNVATALFEKQKLVPVFNMCFEELQQRSKRFKDMGGCGDFLIYEEKYRALAERYKKIHEKLVSSIALDSTESSLLEDIAMKDLLIMTPEFNRALLEISKGKINSDNVKAAVYNKEFVGVTQINIVIEEFHTVPNCKEVEFMENSNTEGTIAYMLKQLARTSRSSGFNLILSTQRATYTEVPNDIKAGLTTTLCHRVNSPNDIPANIPHAGDIKGHQRGRSAYEDGFIQYPYFSGSSMEKLVDKYYVPLKGELFAYKMEDYHKALGGTGSDGMCATMPLKFVIQNNQMFTAKKIVERILPMFGYEFVSQDLTSLDISAVATKGGHKYGILIIAPAAGSRGGFGKSVSDKKLANFRSELSLIEADRYLIFSFEKGGGVSFRESEGLKGISMDFEDMLKMADIMDNQETTKVLGTFDKLFEGIPLTKNLDEEASDDDSGSKKKSESTRKRYSEDEDFSKMFTKP